MVDASNWQLKYCQIHLKTGSEKFWVWWAAGCSVGEPQVETLVLQFASWELPMKFKDAFEYSAKISHELSWFKLGLGALTVPQTVEKIAEAFQPVPHELSHERLILTVDIPVPQIKEDIQEVTQLGS